MNFGWHAHVPVGMVQQRQRNEPKYNKTPSKRHTSNTSVFLRVQSPPHTRLSVPPPERSWFIASCMLRPGHNVDASSRCVCTRVTGTRLARIW